MPDWSQTAGRVIITPVVYANQTAIPLSDTNLSITWKRKDGSSAEANLASGETVAANILTVAVNALGTSSSKLLTYIAYVTYTDPDTSLPINAKTDITFALVQTGVDAKSCWIAGEQVFKYDTEGVAAPAQIALAANVQHVTIAKWQFRNSGGTWTDYPTTADNANITGSTLVIKPTHDVWVGDTATLRVTTSDVEVYDIFTVVKVKDGSSGSSGSSAPMAFLANENITFAANQSGQVSATTVVCNVVAYVGTTKTTPTVGTIGGAVTGMTVTKDTVVNNELPISITIASNATLGGSGQTQGELTVPITAPVNTTLTISWSKVNTGATGGSGAAGQNAIVFSLYAPEGSTFVNHSGTLPIKVAAYDGATAIAAGATYAWTKYQGGSWQAVAGTTDTLTVNGADVAGTATYRCQMTYKTVVYQDVITLVDKTDNYQCTVDSTAGDVFKNAIGETVLIARLWQAGAEVDALKSTVFSVAAPSSPATGDFYYKITKTTPVTALMRYSGSWTDVTTNATYKHTYAYKWYRRDKDGNPLDGGTAFALGKVIFVDGDDVDVKTVFTCEVE